MGTTNDDTACTYCGTRGGYAALWQGGPSYSDGYWETDAFHVHTVHDAIVYLRSTTRRYGRTLMARAVEYDDDGTAHLGAILDSVGTPCVNAGASIILAPMRHALDGDTFGGYASHLIELGPRGGINITRV